MHKFHFDLKESEIVILSTETDKFRVAIIHSEKTNRSWVRAISIEGEKYGGVIYNQYYAVQKEPRNDRSVFFFMVGYLVTEFHILLYGEALLYP